MPHAFVLRKKILLNFSRIQTVFFKSLFRIVCFKKIAIKPPPLSYHTSDDFPPLPLSNHNGMVTPSPIQIHPGL